MFDLSPISESQKQRVSKYKLAKLDRLEVYLPKGNRKLVKEHAKKFQSQEGEPGKAGYVPAGSVTAFVNRAIREAMERDKEAANET